MKQPWTLPESKWGSLCGSQQKEVKLEDYEDKSLIWMLDNNYYKGLLKPQLAEARTKSTPWGQAQPLTNATIALNVCLQGLLFSEPILIFCFIFLNFLSLEYISSLLWHMCADYNTLESPKQQQQTLTFWRFIVNFGWHVLYSLIPIQCHHWEVEFNHYTRKPAPLTSNTLCDVTLCSLGPTVNKYEFHWEHSTLFSSIPHIFIWFLRWNLAI